MRKLTFIEKRDGFSLVELVTVVGLIGAIVAIATTSMNGWQTQGTFDSQKATLYEMLTRARNMANSRNECVKFTVAGQTLVVQGYRQGTVANCGDPLDDKTINFKATIQNGFTVENFNDGSNSTVFTPVGALRTNATATIHMRDSTGRREGFKIYPALGQIRAVK